MNALYLHSCIFYSCFKMPCAALSFLLCLNYHLLFCYVYTILCISRIFCCICNFFHQNAASVRKLAGNHGTESISSFCTNVQYLKCIKDLRALRGIRSFAHAYFLPISFFPFCDQYLYNTANAFFLHGKRKNGGIYEYKTFSF